MVGRPGRMQGVFHSLEIDPRLHERSELKAYNTGLAHAENVLAFPQGGFRNRPGLLDIGGTPEDARRVFPFQSSSGESYDIVFRPMALSVWGKTGVLASLFLPQLTADMLPHMTVAQQLDTMLLFHQDLKTKRLKHAGPTVWSLDDVPWTNVPNYDFGSDIHGDPYTNGVSAQWTLEFVGLKDSDGPGEDDKLGVFVLTVSNQDTVAIDYVEDMTALAAAIDAAIEDLPNVENGVSVVAGTGDSVVITFDGEGNEGDGWAVSGRVVNKTDAAIIARKTIVGVKPGEPLWSDDRGWPQCGLFSGNQRLIVGGFKAIPTMWAFSEQANYYNFDERLREANGPAVVPMAGAGGERIERIVDSARLLIFTTRAEYWLESRSLSATEVPNHVPASRNGTKKGVPIAEADGTAVYAHSQGGVISEMRYTDVEGNFVSLPISLFGSHMIVDVADMAMRKAARSTDGQQLAVINADGSALLSTMLRDQEVMGFARQTSRQAQFLAVAVNGRNELSWLVQRAGGRRLERSDDGLLLDEAIVGVNSPASPNVNCGSRFNGRAGIWCIADGHVFGPFTVAGGVINLPIAVSQWTVGSWMPPLVKTLPMNREVGPKIVVKRKARIHSVKINVRDTTSLAIATNGKTLRDVALTRWGMPADVPELTQGYTGEVTIRGLTGFADDPYLTISQLRPGRLEVLSVTLEAQL